MFSNLFIDQNNSVNDLFIGLCKYLQTMLEENVQANSKDKGTAFLLGLEKLR